MSGCFFSETRCINLALPHANSNLDKSNSHSSDLQPQNIVRPALTTPEPAWAR